MAAQVAVWSLQVLQTPRFKRSRVIYCQNWYCRTASVHWCRNERATAGVVGISQMRWAPGETKQSRARGVRGVVSISPTDSRRPQQIDKWTGSSRRRRVGQHQNAAEIAQRCSPRMARRRTVA